MAVKPIPDGYHTVTPYLIVPGAAKLIDFLKQAFDARESFRMASPEGRIMHAEVRIGDSVVMMSDTGQEAQPRPCMIYLYVNDVDATYKRSLQAGATSLREPANQFYGDRVATVMDRWGNTWSIGTHVEDVSPQEMERRMKAQKK